MGLEPQWKCKYDLCVANNYDLKKHSGETIVTIRLLSIGLVKYVEEIAHPNRSVYFVISVNPLIDFFISSLISLDAFLIPTQLAPNKCLELAFCKVGTVSLSYREGLLFLTKHLLHIFFYIQTRLLAWNK